MKMVIPAFPVLAALLFSSLAAGAHPVKGDDDLKTCLAMGFMAQDSLRRAERPYALTIEELGLDKNSHCEGMELSIVSVNEREFKIQARSKGRLWTVDHTQTLVKHH